MAVPFSFTLLDTFETCPHQTHQRFWLKRKMPDGPESAEGQRVHKALERRLAEGKELPPEYAQWEPLVRGFEGRGTVMAEKGLAVDGALKPATFWAPERFLSAKLDVLVLGDYPGRPGRQRAIVGDWKTGKPREKALQMKLCAILVLTCYPEVDDVFGFNVWLKENRLGERHYFEREKLSDYWSDVFAQVREIEDCERRKSWPKRPSPLCGWCGIFECENNRNRGAQA